MSNENILKYIEVLKPQIKKAYGNNDYKAIILALNQIKKVATSLGYNINPKKYNNKSSFLKTSIGNDKIGDDTLILSFNSSLLCYMDLLGRCNNCDICYAKNSNRMYFNEFLKNNDNQIIILKLLLNEVSFHEVIYNTIYSIYCLYTEKQLNNLKYLRLSVNGDILNNDMLKIIDTIAYHINNVFRLHCYTYTHNKQLDLNLAKNINFNTSDFKIKGCNNVNTIYELDSDLINKIKKHEVILCNGDCNNCIYCKHPTDKPIYFSAHGGKYKGLKDVNNKLLNTINKYKILDFIQYHYDIDVYKVLHYIYDVEYITEFGYTPKTLEEYTILFESFIKSDYGRYYNLI